MWQVSVQVNVQNGAKSKTPAPIFDPGLFGDCLASSGKICGESERRLRFVNYLTTASFASQGSTAFEIFWKLIPR
jgi:hypothetical protein